MGEKIDVDYLLQFVDKEELLKKLLAKLEELEKEVKILREQVKKLRKTAGLKNQIAEDWLTAAILKHYAHDEKLTWKEASELIQRFEKYLEVSHNYQDVRRELNPLRVVLVNIGLKTLLDKMSLKDIYNSAHTMRGYNGKKVSPGYIERISSEFFAKFKDYMLSEFGVGNQRTLKDSFSS